MNREAGPTYLNHDDNAVGSLLSMVIGRYGREWLQILNK